MEQEFDLSAEMEEKLNQLVQDFFVEERKEELGNMEAMFVVDFIRDKIAPYFYNMGVEDSHAFLTDKLDDVFEIEKPLSK